mgnify:CR=1 FL=1
MRKKSTRLLSAALAVCMMLSVLPVGAFAAEPGAEEQENGASAQKETKPYPLKGREIVNDTFVTEHGDVYELSGPYTESITVDTTKNVTLNIVGNVDVNMRSALLNVKDARDLKINAGQYDVVANVKNTDAAAFMNLNASNATVVVQNGRYLDGEQRLSFFTVVAGTLELNNVYIAAEETTFPILNGSVVHINGGELTADGYYIVYNAPWPWAGIDKAGTVIIDGAKIKNGFVGSENGSVEIKNSTLENNDGYCVSVEGGTITLDNVNVSAKGEESHNSRVLDLCGKLYDDTAKKIRITNGGTYEALASGMTVVFGGGLNADVTLDNITIKNGKYGVNCLVDKKHELVIKNVTFEGNDTDIYLSSGEDSEEFGNPYVTIDPTFTSEAKIEVQNPYEGRRITTYTNGKAYQKNLKLTSANAGYVIGYKNDYRGEYRYLTRGYYVDSEKAVATAEINGELNQLDSTKLIAKDTEVTLKATDTAPEGKEFKGWKLYKVVNGTETEITNETELSKLLKNGTETTATLTMPAYNVKAEPYYSNIPYNIKAVDCTVDKTEAAKGDTVTATRRALKANERFTGWTVLVGGEEKEADNFLTQDANDPAKVRFTMPAENVEIKANFEGNPTLNIGDHVTANIEGSDASVPSGSTVPVGETVHLTAIAPEGQHFTGWTVKVGGEEQKADTFLTPDKNDPTKATFTMPSKNVEVTANFASNPTLNPTLRVGDHVTATIEGSDASVPSGSTVPVPKNKIVHLTATAPEGQHFISWTVKVGGEEQKADTFLTTPDENDLTKVTFTMPDANVEVTATFADDSIPEPDPVGPSDTGNIQGAISAVVVGAAAGAIIYEAGTGIYRVINMPGIPMPSNRIELAELLWEHAGKPEPVSTALYSDIDEGDTDAQKAARWAVEQDLMKDDADNNKFHPAFPVSKLRTCLTWNAAKEKGLFDKTEE